MNKLIALYKVWRGGEFIIASIASIYAHVEKIIIVSAKTSWNGEAGNNCDTPIYNWIKKFDVDKKVTVLETSEPSQDAQYSRGFKYIRKNFGSVWVLIIDSDEVWDEMMIQRAKKRLSQVKEGTQAVCCRMWSYIKDIHYRIDDIDKTVTPVIFVQSDTPFLGIRGNGIVAQRATFNEVCVHHFSLVRDSWEEIETKILNSLTGDRLRRKLDLDTWKKEVWNVLPNGPIRYYEPGAEEIWNSLTVVEDKDLPENVRKK